MGFLADLLGKARSEPSVEYTSFYVDAGAPAFVSPDQQYVRVWLRSAHLTEVRRWTTRFLPAVHARFAYVDRRAGLTEVMSVVSPGKSFEALDPRNLNRLVSANLPLLGPVPYRGELTMEVALFSVAGADLAQPYLELLSSLTDAAGVAFLGSVKPFVDPIRRGAELLFKGDGAQLETGTQRADTSLRVGNILVARIPKGSLTPNDVKLDSQDWRLLDRAGRPLTGFPYLVLGIEALARRDDYARIPEVLAGWNDVRGAAQDGLPVDDVLSRFAQFRRTIGLSPDLVQSDKRRITAIFQRELADAGFGAEPAVEGLEALEALPPPRALRPAELLLAPPPTARPEVVAGALEGLEAATPAPAAPISMAELQRLMRDPDVPTSTLRQYFTVTPGASRPFSPSIIPDPARVEVAPPADGLEGAMMMSWANGLCRMRRQELFRRRAAQGLPVLVSEGDSWFQFPIFLEDVIDNLLARFNIWSVDAAGDTLQNMVLQNPEYLQALRARRGDVRAFLFSGGGNDLIGEDDDGEPIVARVLRRFEAGRPAAWYHDTEAVAERLRFIEGCYRRVLDDVQAEFSGLPVLCHGYDYVVPGGAPGDPRRPMWARQDQWIGGPMRDRLGITDPSLQRAIVRGLIDRLNDRIRGLCGGNVPGGAYRHGFHVDVRGTVGDSRWADELHPTDDGYTRVAARFRDVLALALGGFESTAAPEPVSRDACDDPDEDKAHHHGAFPPAGFESLEAAPVPWRVAKALLALRRQVDTMFPGRSRASDGTIGDAAHQGRNSDHNPWVQAGGMGIVTGMDITHDPASGCSGEVVAEALRAARDPRIKYIIWNRRICSATISPWNWRPYGGANPHQHHVHLSVVPEQALYDSEADWVL